MQGLALQVQQGLGRNPHGGDLSVFRGRAGSLVKIIWHDGIAMWLYARRLEMGRLIWPSAKDGAVSLTNSQLACRLEPTLGRFDPVLAFLSEVLRAEGKPCSPLNPTT